MEMNDTTTNPEETVTEREHPLTILCGILLLCFAVFAWYSWVAENDRIAAEVIHCMDGDSSRAAYEACVSQL